jgi:hypothetical protein
MQIDYDKLDKEYMFVKTHLEHENGELRLANIKLNT